MSPGIVFHVGGRVHNNYHMFVTIRTGREDRRHFAAGVLGIWKGQREVIRVARRIPCCFWLRCLLFSSRQKIQLEKESKREVLIYSNVESKSFWRC